MSLPSPRRTRGILVASAAVAVSAIAAPAASAFTSVSIYDGVPQNGYSGNSVGAWSTDAPTTVQVLRGGAVVATSGDMGYTDFDVAAGDVVRVLDAATGAAIGDVAYSGRPAVTACAGSTTFSVAKDAGETWIAAYPDETVQRYSAGDFGWLRGEVDPTAVGTVAGTWPSALPAAAVVNASTGTTAGAGAGEIAVYTSVERRVADLCPKPAAAAPPVVAPAPLPIAPKPQVVTPKELTRQLVARTIQNLVKGGVEGVAKPQSVPVTVPGAGELQIQQFSGAAPKKVTAYAAAAKKKAKAKKVAAPKNLLASGAKTFAKAGSGTVKIKPTKRAKALTKGKKTLSITVRVVFTPKGGKPVAQDQKITLKRRK